VNGQAPPGVKNLEEVGRWTCGGCGACNGVESDAANLMQEMRQLVNNEQIEGGESIGKGHKEEATPPLVDGVINLDIHEANDVQKPAREIPDSKDDAEDEDVLSEDGKDDGDEDIKSDERRVTRIGKKRSVNKRK
jgi:endoplasmic reticulum junction formation protein lunapark